jgi:hypothetical protein
MIMDDKNSLIWSQSIGDFALCVKGNADTLDIRDKETALARKRL